MMTSMTFAEVLKPHVLPRLEIQKQIQTCAFIQAQKKSCSTERAMEPLRDRSRSPAVEPPPCPIPGRRPRKCDGKDPEPAAFGKRCTHTYKKKEYCPICHDCGHGRLKEHCGVCNDCGHGKAKGACAVCNNCGHGKLKQNCDICRKCPHGVLKQNCRICSDCGHGVFRRCCSICQTEREARKL